MNDHENAARKIRKLRASRDLWQRRSAEKQQEIRQLRVTVRDLSSSRTLRAQATLGLAWFKVG